MKSFALLDNVIFKDTNPNAEPLHVDRNGRILRFTLQPGQSIPKHNAPHSPVNIVILKGKGLFAGSDGEAQQFGTNDMVLFDPGEDHAISALDEPLIFLLILHEAPNPNRVA